MSFNWLAILEWDCDQPECIRTEWGQPGSEELPAGWSEAADGSHFCDLHGEES